MPKRRELSSISSLIIPHPKNLSVKNSAVKRHGLKEFIAGHKPDALPHIPLEHELSKQIKLNKAGHGKNKSWPLLRRYGRDIDAHRNAPW